MKSHKFPQSILIQVNVHRIYNAAMHDSLYIEYTKVCMCVYVLSEYRPARNQVSE